MQLEQRRQVMLELHLSAIEPLYVTSSYWTWIFCRGVSGFATDCPCDVRCRGLTTCFPHVGPPFGNRFLNNSWAVVWHNGEYIFIFVFWHMQLYVLIHHIIFWLYLYFLNILYFFKYSCTNIFHRRSLCTFYACSTIQWLIKVRLILETWRYIIFPNPTPTAGDHDGRNYVCSDRGQRILWNGKCQYPRAAR